MKCTECHDNIYLGGNGKRSNLHQSLIQNSKYKTNHVFLYGMKYELVFRFRRKYLNFCSQSFSSFNWLMSPEYSVLICLTKNSFAVKYLRPFWIIFFSVTETSSIGLAFPSGFFLHSTKKKPESGRCNTFPLSPNEDKKLYPFTSSSLLATE